MTKEDLAKLVAARAKDPTAGRYKLIRMTGISEGNVKKWLKGGAKVTTIKPAAPLTVKKGKTLADFRNTYDKATIVPSKVKAAIKEIGASGWEYESQFAKLAGVSLSDLGMFRDEFAGYVVNLRDSRRAWAGSEKTAKTMREMI
jgi:hypothetical protein